MKITHFTSFPRGPVRWSRNRSRNNAIKDFLSNYKGERRSDIYKPLFIPRLVSSRNHAIFITWFVSYLIWTVGKSGLDWTGLDSGRD